MKKSMYIVIAVIVVLIIAGICIFSFSGYNEKESNTLNNAEKVNEEQISQNEQINEQVNEASMNELTNETTNETVADETENTVSSETFEESPKTAEEKAIEIVKNDWKENNNVEFSVEGMDGNGSYIVVVRNSQTTEALAFYSVNVTSETFTKKEMN